MAKHKIRWPHLQESALTKVTPESLKRDAFLRECVKVTRKKNGDALITFNVGVKVSLPSTVVRRNLTSMPEHLIQRVLLDMAVDVLPALRYRLAEKGFVPKR